MDRTRSALRSRTDGRTVTDRERATREGRLCNSCSTSAACQSESWEHDGFQQEEDASKKLDEDASGMKRGRERDLERRGRECWEGTDTERRDKKH